MTGFRKFCTVVFFLAFLLSVGALAANWFAFEPVASIVKTCGTQAWFNYLMAALLAISAIGVAVVLITTLAARSKNSYQETATDFGTVQISKSTLQRTVEDVIYRHPELKFLKCSVRIVNRKKPYVDITAKVAPRGLISLATVAPILQKEIKDAVEKLTGNEVRSVVVDIHENKDASDVMTAEETSKMQANIDASMNYQSLDAEPALEAAEEQPFADEQSTDPAAEEEPAEAGAAAEDSPASEEKRAEDPTSDTKAE